MRQLFVAMGVVWALGCGAEGDQPLQRLAEDTLLGQGEAGLAIVGARTGELLASAGSDAPHQVGSAFKPVLISDAIRAGVTLELPADPEAERWRPMNFEGPFEGPVSLAVALRASRSVPLVRIAELTGTSPERAFGGFDSTVADLTRAWAGLDPAVWALLPEGRRGVSPDGHHEWFLGRVDCVIVGVWLPVAPGAPTSRARALWIQAAAQARRLGCD